MPAKASFTRKQVLDAAFELVRTEGMSALSARRLAERLGCSTQPVYSAYRSMQALRATVVERAEAVARSYLEPSTPSDSPFLQLGLGSLRFAQQEPQLYRSVALSGVLVRDLRAGKPPPAFVLERMKAERTLAGMSDAQLTRINELMWFFSQGLATLFVADTDEDPMPMAIQYLQLAGRAVIEFERKAVKA